MGQLLNKEQYNAKIRNRPEFEIVVGILNKYNVKIVSSTFAYLIDEYKFGKIDTKSLKESKLLKSLILFEGYDNIINLILEMYKFGQTFVDVTTAGNLVNLIDRAGLLKLLLIDIFNIFHKLNIGNIINESFFRDAWWTIEKPERFNQVNDATYTGRVQIINPTTEFLSTEHDRKMVRGLDYL